MELTSIVFTLKICIHYLYRSQNFEIFVFSERFEFEEEKMVGVD